MPLSYNKPSKELVIDLINEANGTKFTAEAISIVNPELSTVGDPERNTMGLAVALPGGGYEGSRTIYWNRPDLGEIFSNVDVFINPGSQSSTADLLPDINRDWDMALGVEDIVVERIDITNPPVKVEIKARNSCLAFVGKFTVTVSNPGRWLDRFIGVEKLDGLQYPTGQSTRIQGPYYTRCYDFSFARELLLAYSVGHVMGDEDLTFFNELMPHPWVSQDIPAEFNLRGASVTFNGDVSFAKVPVNQQYRKVLILKVDEKKCTNVAGYLTFHYDRVRNA